MTLAGADPEESPKTSTLSERSSIHRLDSDQVSNIQINIALQILYKHFKQEFDEEGREIDPAAAALLLEGGFEEIVEETEDFGTAEGYGIGIRQAVRDLWRGNIDIAIFIAIMIFIIRMGFTSAFNSGAAAAGISPEEFTAAERGALEGEIAVDVGSLAGFAVAIAGEARILGGALGPLLGRAELWQNRFEEVRSLGLRMAAGNQKLMWVWNPLKDHCLDCLKYNGRVYRASVWQRYGIRPRMGELECGGWHCGCSFQLTDDPAMPGRPPSPSGI